MDVARNRKDGTSRIQKSTNERRGSCAMARDGTGAASCPVLSDPVNGQLRVATLRLTQSPDVVARGAAFPTGRPSDELAFNGFDVRPDGKGFVTVGSPAERDHGIVVVLGWDEVLRRKLAAARR